jgi:hypothetical protein
MPIINGSEIAKQIRNAKSSIRDLHLIALSKLLDRENLKDNEETLMVFYINRFEGKSFIRYWKMSCINKIEKMGVEMQRILRIGNT